MRKRCIAPVLIVFSVAILSIACKKEVPFNEYTIVGHVKGVNTGWVKLIRPNFVDRDKTEVIDSTQIQNGVFNFKGTVNHIDMVSLFIGDHYADYRGFFLENSPIILNIDLDKADKRGQFTTTVSGSKTHDMYKAQEEKIGELFVQEKYAPLVTLREDMKEAYESKNDSLVQQYREKANSLRKLSDERQEEYQKAKIEYARHNPDSPVATYILGFQFSEGRMTKDRMKTVYKIFQGEAKNTAMYQYYTKTYTDIFETLGIGATAPDFELTTVEGHTLKLSDVKGKYILVDFWASWCVPCRSSFPHLKELYNSYKKDGFEVVAVGTADEETKWKNAIEEDETIWNHVYDESENHKYGKVAKLYGVPFLPTTFLLDENLTIVGRNLSKKELDIKLKDLFKY